MGSNSDGHKQEPGYKAGTWVPLSLTAQRRYPGTSPGTRLQQEPGRWSVSECWPHECEHVPLIPSEEPGMVLHHSSGRDGQVHWPSLLGKLQSGEPCL